MLRPIFIITVTLLLATKTTSALKIYAAGSGEDMLSQSETAAEIIALSGLLHPSVLFIGTATYDSKASMLHQTHQFSARNCTVNSLDVAYLPLPANATSVIQV